jgi:hypothetical protein
MHIESECALGDAAGPQLTWTLTERSDRLIRDRDHKFTDGFDEVFRSTGAEIVRTPFRAPQANGVAERFVRTARSECLDWLLVLYAEHLEHVLRAFIDHDNGHRPHRALALTPPTPTGPAVAEGEWRGRAASRSTWRSDSRVHARGVTGFMHPYRSVGASSTWSPAASLPHCCNPNE